MYFNLEIATVSKCNMACTYCFEGEELKTKKKQTPENLDDIINKIEEMLYNPDFQKTYPQGICVNFWGGEPTLNFEWNKTLILKLSEKSYYDNHYYDKNYCFNNFSCHRIDFHILFFYFVI